MKSKALNKLKPYNFTLATISERTLRAILRPFAEKAATKKPKTKK